MDASGKGGQRARRPSALSGRRGRLLSEVDVGGHSGVLGLLHSRCPCLTRLISTSTCFFLSSGLQPDGAGKPQPPPLWAEDPLQSRRRLPLQPSAWVGCEAAQGCTQAAVCARSLAAGGRVSEKRNSFPIDKIFLFGLVAPLNLPVALGF